MAKDDDKSNRQVRQGDILTTGDFVERARESLDFSRGANVTVNPAEVPSHLRHLIPLVEMWAIAGSGPQLVFIEHVRQNAPEKIDTFVNTLRPAIEDVRAWIRETVSMVNVPDAITHYSYTLSSYELAKPTDSDLVARGRQKTEALKHAKALTRALQDAGDAMRERRYDDVVELLEPIQAELTGANSKKLELARRRAKT